MLKYWKRRQWRNGLQLSQAVAWVTMAYLITQDAAMFRRQERGKRSEKHKEIMSSKYSTKKLTDMVS
jgi:hypothetical protein